MLMTVCARTALISVVWLLAASAFASPLSLVDDLRFVRSGPVPGLCPDIGPTTPFSTFSATQGCISGDASQDSTAEPTGLAGSGTIFTTGGGFDVDVVSHYEITFTVDDPTAFVFDVTFRFDRTTDGNTLNPGTELVASLTGATLPGPVFAHDLPFKFTEVAPGIFRAEIDGPSTFNEQGVLQPGVLYRLLVRNRSDREPFVDSRWNFAFSVPEPGLGLLWPAAVLVGAWRRGRIHPRPTFSSRSS